MTGHIPIIEDVTLTMIVRDEIINPAGGLLPVLELQAPHYPEVVIVDTGSVDGTRELLEHLSGRDFYPHIKVFDHRFMGYADARNFANSKVGTKYAMVVDADEIMFQDDIAKLYGYSLGEPLSPLGIYVDFINVYTVMVTEDKGSGGGWNPRCYQAAFGKFQHEKWERLVFPEDNGLVMETYPSKKAGDALPKIYHFIADDTVRKREEWYDLISWHVNEENPPSSCKNLMSWKKPSRYVLRRYLIDIDEVISRLFSLGIEFPDKTKQRLEEVLLG